MEWQLNTNLYYSSFYFAEEAVNFYDNFSVISYRASRISFISIYCQKLPLKTNGGINLELHKFDDFFTSSSGRGVLFQRSDAIENYPNLCVLHCDFRLFSW